MNSVYEFKNRFVLVDVEGVLLANAGDLLVIREPVNSAETEIRISRDKNTHGADFEYSDAEKPFGFDRNKAEGQQYSGYDLIKAIRDSKGVDGQCKLRIMHKRFDTVYDITRNTGEGNNVQSIVGYLRLLGDFSNVKPGDTFQINTTGSSTYDGNTYTAVTVLYDLPALPGVTLIQVSETLPDSSYQGDWQMILMPEYETPYEGELHFEKCSEKDFEINIVARRVNLGDKLRTRLDAPIALNAAKTLDGDVKTAITGDNMFLHSKALQAIQRASSDSASLTTLFPKQDLINFLNFGESYSENSLTPGSRFFGKPFSTQVESKYGNGLVPILREVNLGSVDLDTYDPVFTFTKNGVLKVDFDCNQTVFITVTGATSGWNITYGGTFIRVNGVETEIDAGGAQFQGTVSAQFPTAQFNINFDYQGEFNINEGDKVQVYQKWTRNLDGLWSTSMTFDDDSNVFELIFLDYEENSLATVYQASNVFEHLVHSMTGIASAFISPFFTSLAERFYFTNGYLIRGFSASDRPPIVSFKELFQGCTQPIFGLGYAIIKESGVAKLVVDRYERFYRNAEIAYISNIEDKSWRYEFDKEVHFNEIEIGYKDYPKATDENKQNNIDEFNTMHKLLTPLQRVKKKFKAISEVIASGYKIENQRREQFKKVPADTVSDDDKIFIIKGSYGKDYTIKHLSDNSRQILKTEPGFIWLYGTHFDLKVGDDITLTRSDSVVLVTNENVNTIAIDGAYTKIGVSATLTSGATTAHDWTVAIAQDRLRAARDEEFASVTNVISPETSYNLGINPKYMLINHSLLLNSGLANKPNSDLIRSQQVFLNREMACQFGLTEGDYTLAEINQAVTMDADTMLSKMNAFNKLFSGRLMMFSAKLDFPTSEKIRDAHLDSSLDYHYGYLRVKDPYGVDRFGWVMDMKYMLLSEMCSFILREKSADVIVITEYTHSLVIGFASSSAACLTVTAGATHYSDTQTLVVGSTIYTTSQDSSTTLADGWVYDVANNRPIQITGGQVVAIGATCSPPPGGNKSANYGFFSTLGFSKSGTVSTIIDALNYFENNASGINIGSDGASISVTYDVTQDDLDDSLADNVGLVLNVYNGANDQATEIGTQQGTNRGTPGQLSIVRSVNDGDITSEIYIKVTISNSAPE